MKECEVVEDLKSYSYGEGALPGFGEGDSCSAGQEWADALASEAQGVVDRGKEPFGRASAKGAGCELLLYGLTDELELLLLVRVHCHKTLLSAMCLLQRYDLASE